MQRLIALSRGIDAVSGRIGRAVAWLIVVAAVVSAGNAVIRKLFDVSSNAWLEAQWWLFAIVFLLAAPWTLAQNEHIRIDVVNNLFPRRVKDGIELIGHVFFLIPSAAVILVTSWAFFMTSYLENEQSANAGGLPQWPIKLLIPVAFALLLVQGVSELIKRVAIMRGEMAEPQRREGYHDTVAAVGVALKGDDEDGDTPTGAGGNSGRGPAG